jgi:hypothetical protein
MLGEVTLAAISVRAVQYSPVGIIPPTLHTHVQLPVIDARRTKARGMGKCPKTNPFSENGQN